MAEEHLFKEEVQLDGARGVTIMVVCFNGVAKGMAV
jgi:hypothetical protein